MPHTTTPAMRMAAVPDGKGGVTHQLLPAPASAGRGRTRAAVTPAPILASPEAAAQQLRLFVERLETLDEEKRGIATDMRDVLSEAKAYGFDVRAIKSILTLRRMDPNHRAEEEAILDTYKTALGLQF